MARRHAIFTPPRIRPAVADLQPLHRAANEGCRFRGWNLFGAHSSARGEFMGGGATFRNTRLCSDRGVFIQLADQGKRPAPEPSLHSLRRATSTTAVGPSRARARSTRSQRRALQGDQPALHEGAGGGAGQEQRGALRLSAPPTPSYSGTVLSVNTADRVTIAPGAPWCCMGSHENPMKPFGDQAGVAGHVSCSSVDRAVTRVAPRSWQCPGPPRCTWLPDRSRRPGRASRGRA